MVDVKHSFTRVDFHADRGGDMWLQWSDAPAATTRAIPPAVIDDLRRLTETVSVAENRDDSKAIVETRLSLGRALASLLNGADGELDKRIEAATEQCESLVLVLRATTADAASLHAHPATWMRLEMLPFEEIHQKGYTRLAVLLQLGPEEIAPPRILPHGGLRILFMAASPQDAPPELDFEHEEETLLSALAPLAEKRRAHLRVVEEGTLEGLAATLCAEHVDVVHISCHGIVTPDGPRLVMEDDFGGTHLVSPAALVEVLRQSAAMPPLVMLAACHSAEVRGSFGSFAAALVAAGVSNVIGWTRPVRDELATLAASVIYAELGAGKTPQEAAELAREHMRKIEERALYRTHAWGTLHLVSNSASGFRIDTSAEPLRELSPRDEVYKYLGSQMRVLESGFVGRRRLVQRLLRILVRGMDTYATEPRGYAGVCVIGMKGVGKSCAAGRTLERAKQSAKDLFAIVVHGVVDERSMLEAVQRALAKDGADDAIGQPLLWVNEPVSARVVDVLRRLKDRPIAIVLDDFEQCLERRTDGPFVVSETARPFLEALVPLCASSRAKLLITSTASFVVPGDAPSALAFVPLGSFDAAAVRKLWMRGQASDELACISLGSFQTLAERLGCNARILTWARALCAGKSNEELEAVARGAAERLPTWEPGDEASEEKHAELANLFLRHMAYGEACAVFGEDAHRFIKRARVFDHAVPKAAFRALAEGLSVNVERDLDVLANFGLMEVGEMDGVQAFRVSPLVEAKFDEQGEWRFHEVAATVWETLAEGRTGGIWLERTELAWEHALRARNREHAERLGRRLHGFFFRAGLYAEDFRHGERHLRMVTFAPFGYLWAGAAGAQLARDRKSLETALERMKQGRRLLSDILGPDHVDVAAALYEFARVLQKNGDLHGARKAAERSLATWITARGTEAHPDIAGVQHLFANILLDLDEVEEARTVSERALNNALLVRQTENHPDICAAYHTLGCVLQAQAELPQAREAFVHSIAIAKAVFGADEHPYAAASLYQLGTVLEALGDHAGAADALESSIDLWSKVLGTAKHSNIAGALFHLACVHRARGDLVAARKALLRSIAIDSNLLGPDLDLDVVNSMRELGVVHRLMGDQAEALRVLEDARDASARVNARREKDEAVRSESISSIPPQPVRKLAAFQLPSPLALAGMLFVLVFFVTGFVHCWSHGLPNASFPPNNAGPNANERKGK